MIKITPDHEGKFVQWDKDRQVLISGLEPTDGTEIHVSMPNDDHGAYVVKFADGKADIPNILLTMNGVLTVSIYEGNRTTFSVVFSVAEHEKPDDYIYTETEVLNYKTLDEKIGDLAKLTTTARENLVAAINEAATKGTAAIYMRVAEGYIEYSGDDVTWEKLIAVDELKGPKGDQGERGPQGEPGEKGDKGDPGKDAAADISLGITSAAVGDIVKVKAVDASGKPTEWESYFPGYRLLCTQTLEEEANTIKWTQDVDGKAFDFTGLQEVTLALAFPSDYTSNNLLLWGFGDGYSFSNGDTFRYAIVKNTFFSSKLIYKESIVFKATSYQWQDSNAVRKQYYATFTESQDALHPASIGLQGQNKAFPIGTIASVYVR